MTGAGGWTLFSTDSGVTVIHATPIPNGQVFVYDRPGNRETRVWPHNSSCFGYVCLSAGVIVAACLHAARLGCDLTAVYGVGFCYALHLTSASAVFAVLICCKSGSM